MKTDFVKDILQADHFVAGINSLLKKKVLQPDGQWDDFLPIPEIQNRNGIEPLACTTFGTLNVIETLYKRLYGEDRNFSDRYVAIASGTSTGENSPHKVAECIRTYSGLIDEEVLPFDTTITTHDAFYTPNPITIELLKIGIEWCHKFSFGHEWIFSNENEPNKAEKMKEALKYSPLGVSVFAWAEDENGYQIKLGADNHWCEVYGYVEGEYWKALDTYDNVFKKIAWNTQFECVKGYKLSKVDNSWLFKIFYYIISLWTSKK